MVAKSFLLVTYILGDQGSILVGVNNYSPSHSVETDFTAQKVTYLMGTCDVPSGVSGWSVNLTS